MNAYRAIDRTKIQFDFAHYHNPDDSNSYREEIEALGGRVIKIKCLSEAGFKGFYDQFVKLFSENHYDAVHAHNIHHNGIQFCDEKWVNAVKKRGNRKDPAEKEA